MRIIPFHSSEFIINSINGIMDSSLTPHRANDESPSLAPTKGPMTSWITRTNKRSRDPDRSHQQKVSRSLQHDSHYGIYVVPTNKSFPDVSLSILPTKGFTMFWISPTNKRLPDPAQHTIPIMESPSIPPTKGFPTVWIDPTNKRFPDPHKLTA